MTGRINNNLYFSVTDLIRLTRLIAIVSQPLEVAVVVIVVVVVVCVVVVVSGLLALSLKMEKYVCGG